MNHPMTSDLIRGCNCKISDILSMVQSIIITTTVMCIPALTNTGRTIQNIANTLDIKNARYVGNPKQRKPAVRLLNWFQNHKMLNLELPEFVLHFFVDVVHFIKQQSTCYKIYIETYKKFMIFSLRILQAIF